VALDGTLGGVVRIPVQAGKEKEFEDVFLAMRAGVHAHEPGCKMYDLFRNRKADEAGNTQFVVLERWADQAALDSHREQPHMKEGLPKLAGLVAGAPDSQFFDIVK